MTNGRPEKINQIIWRVFTKTHGLTLKTEAVEYLNGRLGERPDLLAQGELVNALSFIASTYKKQKEYSTLIDRESLVNVIEGMSRATLVVAEPGQGYSSARNFINVLNASECPRWDYDHSQRLFVQNNEKPSVFGRAESKISMHYRNFEIIKQRTQRAEQFNKINATKISSIKSIKGQRHGERKVLFGMLSQIFEDELFLEDPEDYIKLEISDTATILPALYTETSMVIVGGFPCGEKFQVEFMSPAPLESRIQSTESLSHPTYHTGLPFSESIAHSKSLEGKFMDLSIVLLSDVWLDCNRTLSKLQKLLCEYESLESVPGAFIIMGPFTVASNLHGSVPAALTTLRKAFSNLSQVIGTNSKLLTTSKFIFIPAIDDPLSTKTIPRPPLPDELLNPLRERGIECIMASNPARLFVFSKEIILYRNDMTVNLYNGLLPQLSKYANNNNTGGAFRTLLEQSHLSPLPLTNQPRLWEFDHALTLYPIPDMLFLAERTKFFKSVENGCVCVNPGSFATSESSFALIYPLLGKVEACKV